MKSNKKLLGRALAMALAVVMVLGMPGVGQVFAAAGDPDDTAAIMQDAGTGDTGGDGAVVPDGVQEGAQEGAGDVQDGVPGEGSTPDQECVQGGPEGVPGASEGDDIDQDQGQDQEQGPGSGDDVMDPGEGGDAAAALAAFQAACQAFLSEFDHEKAMHLDGQDHACAYRDFGMFLEKFNAAVFTEADLSAEPEYTAMMDVMDAKLSKAAVSVYVFRGEAVLGRSYDSLDAFDGDVSYMVQVLEYMLPADLNGALVSGMDGRIRSAREALAESLSGGGDVTDPETPGDGTDPAGPGNPGEPEGPEQPEEPIVPESVQAVRDAYAAFCGSIDGMAFDMILAELDRISGLVSAVMPEDMTEDVAAVAGYLPGIRSERAFAEFCDKILAIRDKAAAGAYDNKSEDFDREAARAEFDAVRNLKNYMLEAELTSESYNNGLKILANLETLMDTPVEQGPSEKALAFLEKAAELQAGAETEYAGRPYALDKAVSNLLTECTKLDPADLLDENVQAAKTALENMRRRIVVKPEIKAFLDAAYALLDAVNAGLDLESDQAVELAAAVVEAMDALTESDMAGIEVSEAYQKLVDAGLVPEDDVRDPLTTITTRTENSYWPVIEFGTVGVGDHSFWPKSYVSNKGIGVEGQFVGSLALFSNDEHIRASDGTIWSGFDPVTDKVYLSSDFTEDMFNSLQSIPDEAAWRQFLSEHFSEAPVEADSDDVGVFYNIAFPEGTTACFVEFAVPNETDAVRNIDDFTIAATPSDGVRAGERVGYKNATIMSASSLIGDSGFRALVPLSANRWTCTYVVDRQVSGALFGPNGPIENAELALFSYDVEAETYTRLERDASGQRIEFVKTDAVGNYLVPHLPEGQYYIAVRGIDDQAPADDSGLTKVVDGMHGLAGWQFVTELPVALMGLADFKVLDLSQPENCLQNVVKDFAFEAGLPPYEVNITWLDMPGATLSEDKTHADIEITRSNYKTTIASSMRLEVLFNDDVSAGTDLLTMPFVLTSIPVSDSYGLFQGMSAFYQLNADNSRLTSTIGSVQGLCLSSDNGKWIIRTDADFDAGTKLSIPLTKVVSGALYSDFSSKRYWCDVPVDFDGIERYVFHDGFGGMHELTFTSKAELVSLDVSKSGSYKSFVTKNTKARLFTWSPSVETMYGVTEAEFDALVADGHGLFEYGFRVSACSNTLAHLDLNASATNGDIEGMAVFSVRHASGSETGIFVNDWRVQADTNGHAVVYPAKTNYGNDKTDFGRDVNKYLGRYEGCVNDTMYSYDASIKDTGVFVYVLASYALDDVVDIDAGKTLTECMLHADFIADYSGDVLSDEITLSLFEPMTYFPSNGNMYSFRMGMGSIGGKSRGNMAPLLLGGEAFDFIPVAEGKWQFSEGSDPDNISLTVDHITFSNGASSGLADMSILGSGDYYVPKVSIDTIVGKAYYSDNGELLEIAEDLDTYGEDELFVYVCTSESPNTWLLDGTVTVRDCSGPNTRSYVFHHDDVVRVKVDYPGRRSFVALAIWTDVHFKSDGPIMSEMLQMIKDNYRLSPTSVSVSYPMQAYGSLLCWDDNGPKAVFPKDTVKGMLADELNASCQGLYADWYDVDTYPLRGVSEVARYYISEIPVHGIGAQSVRERDGANVSELATYIVAALSGYGLTLDELYRSDAMNLTDAEFYVHVPDDVEIVDVIPGFAGSNIDSASVGTNYKHTWVDVASADSWDASNGNTERTCSIIVDSDYVSAPIIDYDFVQMNGHTVLHVRAYSTYDKKHLLSLVDDDGKTESLGHAHNSAFAASLQFGGFTIITRPKYTSYFTNTQQTMVNVAGQVLTGQQNTYYGDAVWLFMKDNIGSNLSDVNKNGDKEERCAFYGRGYTNIDTAAYVSGLQVSARGSDSQFWNRSVTTRVNDPYAYRLTYSQMAETSKNVVLFDSLEDLPGNTWTGELDSVDLSDAKAKGLSVKVYVNEKNIDSVKYVRDNVTGEQLAAGYDGWVLLTECMPDDPGSYDISSGLASVKSVAFDFGDQEFAKDQAGKPSVVQAYLNMRAPGTGFVNGSNPVQNRAFYSDVLIGSGKARSVMASTVTVDLVTAVSYEMSKTVSPDPEIPDGWLVQQDPGTGKLTVDKSGKPSAELGYTYTLRFDMMDPGKGKYDRMSSLVLYDDLESGTDSRYAGRLDGISITGRTYGWVELLGSLIPDNVDLLTVSDINAGDCMIYVSVAGEAGDPDLPGALTDATGRTDWIQTDASLSGLDNGRITAVAVCLPGLITAHGADGAGFDGPAYLQVDLDMTHAGRTGFTGVDRTLKNGFTASFVPNGTDGSTTDARPDLTEVEIVYKNAGVVLPVTGGPGVKAMCVTGLAFLVPAAFALAIKKRKGDNA